MKYTENAASLAESELAARRSAAEEEQLRREAEIAEKVPEIGSMKRTLRENYLSLIKLVASHDKNAAEQARAVRDKSIEIQQRIAIMLENMTGDPDYLEPKYTCPKCRDSGYVEGVRCECLETLLRKYTLEDLNKSSAIKLHDFSEFREDYYPEGEVRERMVKIRNMLISYCRELSELSRSMLFVGNTGLGKTFLSACVVKALGEEGIHAAFMSAFDMLRALEDDQFGRTANNTMDQLLTAQLLVIDDLGAEPPGSKYYESFLYNVINGRLNRSLPTIISTNLPPEKLKERYHDRIASRILSEYLPVVFRGSDIRQQKAAAERGKRA